MKQLAVHDIRTGEVTLGNLKQVAELINMSTSALSRRYNCVINSKVSTNYFKHNFYMVFLEVNNCEKDV